MLFFAVHTAKSSEVTAEVPAPAPEPSKSNNNMHIIGPVVAGVVGLLVGAAIGFGGMRTYMDVYYVRMHFDSIKCAQIFGL